MNVRLTAVLAVVVFLIASPRAALAQGDGARMYWKTLTDSNAVTFIPIHMTGNSNPLDPAHIQPASASFEANIALVGYSRTLDLFGRSAIATISVPMGNLSGDVTGVPLAQQQDASGFGDPMLQLVVNIYGAPAMNDLLSLQRYEPKFTIDFLASLALPVGEYDGNQALNIGQNRWYGRIGAPMMVTFGPWVPGERTTLEFLPAVWLFGENDNYMGQTLSTDPMLQLEAHLTRDLTPAAWASLDAAWFSGSKSQIGGVQQDGLDNIGIGITFGYQVNDNLLITVGYFSTINDSNPGDLQGDQFRINFTFGWNGLIEGMKRLSGEH